MLFRSADINEANRITVNGTRINAPPYIIKAIGNRAYLESAVNINDGAVDKLKKAGHDIEIQSSTSNKLITISAYSGTTTTKYMKDKEE